MATKAQLRTSVLMLCGSHSQLTAAAVNEFLESEDRAILEIRDWERRYATTVLGVSAPYTTGTVSITSGTAGVVGVGTTFTSAMVGRFIRIAGLESYYKITAFVDATNLTIEAAWVEATQTGKTYSVFQSVIALPSDCEKVVAVKSRRDPLDEKTTAYFDAMDPSRVSTSSDPTDWANADRNSSGVRQIEIWPPVTAAQPIWVRYQKVADLSSDSSTPLYLSDLLKWRAASDAAAFLFAKTNDQTWAALGKSWFQLYLDALNEETINDLSKSSTNKAASPSASNPGGDFYLNHDAWNP